MSGILAGTEIIGVRNLNFQLLLYVKIWFVFFNNYKPNFTLSQVFNSDSVE